MAVSSAHGTPLLGRYRVAELVGRGAFGRVLKVIDAQTSETRALKVSARAESMLLDEFAQLARLRHPSLPRVFEVGRTTEAIDDVAAGAPFFVAEWIAGGRADARRWDEPHALWSLLADIAGALAVIHAAGLVHGDVAPANILLVDDESRAVLVDLGLAAPSASIGAGARGTPQYMAPEAFAGHLEPRSDLYSLGATVVRLVTGRPLFDAPALGELVQRVMTASAPPPLPMLPRPLGDLVGRLVARDADERPASALALLDELDQLAPVIAPGQTRRARPKVGAPPAPAAWPGAAPVIDELARNLGGRAAIHVVAGVEASGARPIADAAVRRWQLDVVTRGRRAGSPLTGTIDSIAAALRIPAVAGSDSDGRRWVDATARAVAACEGLVVVELGDDYRARTFLASLVRNEIEHPVVVVVDDPANAPTHARDDVMVYEAPLLDADALGDLARTMLGREAPRVWIQGLLDASHGEALTAIDLVRSLASEADPYAIDWTTRTSTRGTAHRQRQVEALSASARQVVLALAVCGGHDRIDRVLAAARARDNTLVTGLADVVELERAGLVRRRGDELAIDRTTSAAIQAATAVSDWEAMAVAGLAVHDDVALDVVAALLVSAPVVETAERACAVAEELFRRGRADRAREVAARISDDPASACLARTARDVAARISDDPAIPRSPAVRHVAARISDAPAIPRELVARAAMTAARAAAATGAYRDVAALAHRAREAGADRVATDLVIARAAQKSGDLDTAEATLANLYAAEPGNADVAGTYARLLVTRSRFADAKRIASAGGGALAGLRAEAAGLAAFYLGELDDADRAFAALEVGGSAAGDGASVGRALSLRGMVAQQRGQLGLASDRYREAARKLGEVGEVHAAAVAELNLGTVLAERGRASEALPRLAAASRVFADLDATTEQVAADLNRGNALLALGQAEDAYAAADEAVRQADGAPHLRAFALLVLGDALRRLGEEIGAERSYRDALAIGLERKDAHAQVSAYIALAEAGHRVDADVEALCASDDDRDRWTIARGRLALRVLEVRRNRTGSQTALRDTGSRAALRETGALPSQRDTGPRAALRETGAVPSLRETGGLASQIDTALRETGGLPSQRDTGTRAALRETGALPSQRDTGPRAALRETGGLPSQRETGAVPSLRDTSRVSGTHVALRDPLPVQNAAVLRDSGSYGALRYAELEWPTEADLLSLANACAEVAARAADGDRLERAFRGLAVAAALAQKARDTSLARTLGERARAAHAALVAATAPVFRAALEADPDVERIPGNDARPERGSGYRDDAAHLRRLLTLSRRLNTEPDVERILDEVIDTAIELTAAERGFLLLRQSDGELAPVVSRNFAMGDLESGDRSVSRSIAERAAQTGEPVVTVDAGVDERFAVAASVAALRLRSVLVVPLRQRGVVTGCIYVDHRLRGGAFDDAAATLLGELADIAAIAIENARLTDDLRRTTREVDDLNRRLSSELADREAELVRAKADLPDRDRLRNRYESIIGKSPAMVRMLDVLDRAAATSLAVVIVGESGTGKELVARALHDHGPRRDGAFVAINCSAVPEPLLESELFGHVRGAFTGAERDRRGLFEVADGGTLFLDEVADTSPAMQAKLLRVLQDGMIRRVGDTKTRKVDVRIITASQRSLAELAAAGTFREDLRFRLEVITIPVPPLRERDGDVPLLVEQLLALLCRGRTPPRLTRAALRALGQHRWPGNVRELENALARGLAMGGDMIDIADLPEAIATAAARPEPAKPSVGEDLRLKPALVSTEQAYISAAMARAKGNQTVAARLLGLSRFGLQKKLRRLAGEDDANEDEP